MDRRRQDYRIAGLAGGLLTLAAAMPVLPQTKPKPKPAAAAMPPDLTRVDRSIGKEPRYGAEQPLYALLLFGPDGKRRVWTVLDKSTRDAERYDLLYFDRNANGSLTDPGERIVGTPGGAGAMNWNLGTVKDPATGAGHTQFRFTQYATGIVSFTCQWRGGYLVSGGFDSRATPACQFSPDRKTAPVFWPGSEKPLQFLQIRAQPFPIGRPYDLHVVLGRPGSGKHSFTAVGFERVPKGTPVHATLEYTDGAGRARRATGDLRRRCCTFEFFGFLPVPADARPGPARLRLELPADEFPDNVPVTLAVELKDES